MYLRTFGRLALEGTEFTRPKPLLLVAYLAVEGPVGRRQVAELFWPDARDHMKSLTVALSRIRSGAPGAVAANDERAWATVASDAAHFLERLEDGDRRGALEEYRGPFLDGFYLRAWSVELEGWVYKTREFLAANARGALLDLGEAEAAMRRFAAAAEYAERALALSDGAMEPDDMARLHTLLLAGNSAQTAQVRRSAEEFDVRLCTHADEARKRLTGDRQRASTPVQHNLPASSGAFVDRDLELGELETVIDTSVDRLVTIKGPAGVGKTRLALEAARRWLERGRFPDGVFFVTLESLTTPELIPGTIADALGLELTAAGAPLRQVADRIGDREVLLVLDSFEHLTDGAVMASELVRACPRLQLVVSSREQLNVAEERVFPLAGLSHPQRSDLAVDEASRFGAVALYLERARRVHPEFELTAENLPGVLETCRLVEGLPLGIELAATWLGVLPPQEIASQIARDLDFLVTRVRNAPERHQSLRRALEHSWRLLSEEERAVLRKLAVFRGGFRRDAAGDVAGATVPVLASLVEKSLLRIDPSWRYDRHPLVFQFTREKLAEHPDEHRRARERHGRRYFDFLHGLADALVGSGQSAALAAIERELDNVRLAWRWAADERRAFELQRGCRPLQLFYIQRGGMAEEGAREFGYAADRLEASAANHRVVLGRLRIAEAWFRFRLGDSERSAEAARQGLDLLQTLSTNGSDESAATAAEGAVDAASIARAVVSAHHTLGHIAKRRGDHASAQEHYEAAMDLARRWHNEPQIAIASNNLALVMKERGRYAEAERLHRQAIALNRAIGNHRSVVRNLTNLGAVLVLAEDRERAEQVSREAMRLAGEIGYDATVPELLASLGSAAFAAGRYASADRLFRDALERRSGDRAFEMRMRQLLGRTAAAQGDAVAARRRYREALEAVRPDDDWALAVESVIGIAELCAAQGDLERAACVLYLVRDDPRSRESARRRRALDRALGASLPDDFLRRVRARADGKGREEIVAEALRQISAP